MVDNVTEKITGMKHMVVTIEIGMQVKGKNSYKGVMVIEEIEALAMIDLDQGPELVQIGIE